MAAPSGSTWSEPAPVAAANGAAARPRAGRRILFADGLRGLAALWVVLFHAAEGKHVQAFQAVLPPWLSTFAFDWGHLGVAVFFVLSGYVMVRSVEGAETTARFGGRFLLRRLVRLSPPYWASIAFVLAYGALKAAFVPSAEPVPGSPAVVAAHVLYLQDFLALPAISVVYWTLCIEIQFYLVFVVLLVLRQRLRATGVASADGWVWAGAALVGLPWAMGWTTTPVVPGSFLPFWFAFVAGAAVGRARSPARFGAALAFVAVLVAGWASTASGVVGAAVVAALVLLVGSSWPAWTRVLESRPLQWLGLVSYSLYLTHNQVTGATAFVLRRWLPTTPAAEALLLAGVVAASLGVAALGWALVERPSMALSRRISLRA